MQNITIKSLFKPFVELFRRYHLTIFIVVVVGGLAVSVIIFNDILASSTDISGYTAEVTNASFDQSTITKLQQLHTSSENVEPTLPSGRINPFSE